MTETFTLGKAINTGLRRAMERDPKVLIMGEDVGKLGGVFRITDGLQKDFGEDRVMDTPLAESGIIGTAVGLAIRGYRPRQVHADVIGAEVGVGQAGRARVGAGDLLELERRTGHQIRD